MVDTVRRQYTVDSIFDVLGNTPLVSLAPYNAGDLEAWVKLEQFNPGGSAKDRTARALVAAADIAPGTMVVESSSGNLGVALSREAVVGQWDFHCVLDPRTNQSTVAYMAAMGATIHMLDQPDPATGDWLAARRAKVQQLLADNPGAINLNQYANTAAFTAHDEGTMAEIVHQLGSAPDYLLVAVSTTGTIGGCLRYIEKHNLHTQVIAVDAEGSVLFGGTHGQRLLPGFGAGVEPELSQSVHPHRIMRIPDIDSVRAAREIARTTAILPGASAGAVAAALHALGAEGARGSAVAIFHDGGHAYLDTVYNDKWVEDNLGTLR
ncbi:MAG: pyridoxal-phosphate dependent enzyme [Corynebacterium sp.]|nr:pyridoxal-phosphate dependent enzyme [Corynebacterium sp.]